MVKSENGLRPKDLTIFGKYICASSGDAKGEYQRTHWAICEGIAETAPGRDAPDASRSTHFLGLFSTPRTMCQLIGHHIVRGWQIRIRKQHRHGNLLAWLRADARKSDAKQLKGPGQISLHMTNQLGQHRGTHRYDSIPLPLLSQYLQ
jgi:hypothetical protein